MWKFACFIEVEGCEHMSIGTVLYISDKSKTVPGDPVAGALRNAGYEVVSADRAIKRLTHMCFKRTSFIWTFLRH